MKLHRLALVELETALPYVAKWGFVSANGVQVNINHFTGAMDPPEVDARPSLGFLAPRPAPTAEPTRIMLTAVTNTTYEVVPGRQIRIPLAPRELAEDALAEMASVIGILSEAAYSVWSPNPYLLLSAETAAETQIAADTKRIILPAPRVDRPMMGTGLRYATNVAGLLPDRPDGVLLLGAAAAAGHGVAKLHELFRVFENAFALAGLPLVGPLAEFLNSYPDWDLEYTSEEVRFWVEDLRNPATHADLSRSKRIARDPDVERDLFRIEQAAYDVLFNKSTWHSGDSDRLMRWAFSSATTPDGRSIVRDGASFRTDSAWDHFHAFRLGSSFRLDGFDEPGWVTGGWHFSESEWEEFNEAGGSTPASES